MSVCLCLKIFKTRKRAIWAKRWPKADIYATCTITFMFMYVVVLETAVSAIYSATYYSLLVSYAVFFRVLPCVIVTSVYYAVFFRVRLLLVPDLGSRSRLQHRARVWLRTTAVLRGVYTFTQYAVFFRVLPCVIVAPVYYAVFFRVRLLLRAYYDSLVPDPGSRSMLQPRAHNIERSAREHLLVSY